MFTLIRNTLISSLINLIISAFSEAALKTLIVAGIDRAIKSDRTGEELDKYLEEVKKALISKKDE